MGSTAQTGIQEISSGYKGNRLVPTHLDQQGLWMKRKEEILTKENAINITQKYLDFRNQCLANITFD